MKFYTSYFYKIRFFNHYQIPISTALYSPKWYTRNGKPYLDNNGVLNGIKFPEFSPQSLEGLCHGNPCDYTPDSCEFLKRYRELIFKIDFSELMEKFKQLEIKLKSLIKTDNELEFMLMIYEVPSNPCSERTVIQDYFRSNGVEISEYE